MHPFHKWLLVAAGVHATSLLHPAFAAADERADPKPRNRFEHPDPRLPSDPLRPPVLVHVRSPDPVDLERETGDRYQPFALICTAPCDTLVPASGRYRITGDSVRASRPFTFPADTTEDSLGVDPASSVGFVGGIVLVSVGGAALGLGLLGLMAGSYADGPDGGTSSAFGAALAIGGLVALVTGGVLWASNSGTGVKHSRGPGAEAPPERIQESSPEHVQEFSPAPPNFGVARFALPPESLAAPVFIVPIVRGTL